MTEARAEVIQGDVERLEAERRSVAKRIVKLRSRAKELGGRLTELGG